MVSVAKASPHYWLNEGSKWEDLSDAVFINPREGGYMSAVKADIKGAGVGALRGAYIGFTGGTVAIPGLGTAVGGTGGVMVGMISGAILGSAGAALSTAFWNLVWD